jgi:hypothetical protein
VNILYQVNISVDLLLEMLLGLLQLLFQSSTLYCTVCRCSHVDFLYCTVLYVDLVCSCVAFRFEFMFFQFLVAFKHDLANMYE